MERFLGFFFFFLFFFWVCTTLSNSAFRGKSTSPGAGPFLSCPFFFPFYHIRFLWGKAFIKLQPSPLPYFDHLGEIGISLPPEERIENLEKVDIHLFFQSFSLWGSLKIPPDEGNPFFHRNSFFFFFRLVFLFSWCFEPISLFVVETIPDEAQKRGFFSGLCFFPSGIGKERRPLPLIWFFFLLITHLSEHPDAQWSFARHVLFLFCVPLLRFSLDTRLFAVISDFSDSPQCELASFSPSRSQAFLRWGVFFYCSFFVFVSLRSPPFFKFPASLISPASTIFIPFPYPAEVDGFFFISFYRRIILQWI